MARLTARSAHGTTRQKERTTTRILPCPIFLTVALATAVVAPTVASWQVPAAPAAPTVQVGGSRTLPGQFSVRASRLPAILEDKHHKGHIPMDDFRRIALWLDLGCPMRDDYGDGRNLD